MLLFVGVLYVLSAIGCAFANGVGLLIAARGIGLTNLVFTFVDLWLTGFLFSEIAARKACGDNAQTHDHNQTNPGPSG